MTHSVDVTPEIAPEFYAPLNQAQQTFDRVTEQLGTANETLQGFLFEIVIEAFEKDEGAIFDAFVQALELDDDDRQYLAQIAGDRMTLARNHKEAARNLAEIFSKGVRAQRERAAS